VSWLVLVRQQAEVDVAKARDWYDAKRAGLGDEFFDDVARSMQALESAAHRERHYYRNFRRIRLSRFPYKIFYQIVGERVIVFRVLHAKQDHERRMGED
jgi:plasmid stabilization system protein ParE